MPRASTPRRRSVRLGTPGRRRDDVLRARNGPALAMLQFGEVPKGLRALDALVKEASVEVLAAGTVQCGHYLVAFGGQVEAVLRSFNRAKEVGGSAAIDSVLLPDAEERIVPAFRDGVVRSPQRTTGDALGVIQSAACPVLLGAVDAGLKGAHVDLVELRVAEGLGGKALATLWGELHDVEAAVEIACGVIQRQVDRGAIAPAAATTEVIPNADDGILDAVSSGTRFFQEWRG
jgi:microcompartment protein CcmL/EutN